ncbi:HpcH/HpaI aldolase/citrate lyase family protein [Dyadobacter sp. CY323]|uniref:HpcH/HpaI aldolase family protein n=1 Tax=Dyadobacter sp. CY323 TaxID=2907302 RepID=UPI001F2DB8A2|nr:aldolase/citrate lyase family protein [Dyadobacter sp. CY323]MCE6988559.1 aldolase/citrate lyase family protein [Dyadobacter sp. CY323]
MHVEKDDLVMKLSAGATVYGTCLTNLSSRWLRTVSGAELDFVFLDTEHIPSDRASLSEACWLLRYMGITPIVRIANPDPFLAVQALDAGAIGIVVPYIETVAQLTALTGAIKYRPLKGELLEAALADTTSISQHTSKYLNEYNAGHLLIANIESKPALERLDELLAQPGLDGVFIGPHDLSVSLDVAEQYDHPDFEEAVRRIVRSTRKAGKHVGIQFWMGPEIQSRWVGEGVDMVIHSNDMSLFSQKLESDIHAIRQRALYL